MFDLLLGIFIGALIGWHFPQPEWAKNLLSKFK